MREYYVDWRKRKPDRILERTGIATGLGLSLIAVITGLVLGLKRSGNDIINTGVKPKPIKPGEKTRKKSHEEKSKTSPERPPDTV